MLQKIAGHLITRAENRLGVRMDHVRAIAAANIGLLRRYNTFFSFLDPNKNAPAEAYYLARIRGALAADCGSCVEIEFNLAVKAGVDQKIIASALSGDVKKLEPNLVAVCKLADAVVRDRMDDAEARAAVRAAYGDAGLVELSYAMNGAAMLPGIKRAMGYAITCDPTLINRLTSSLAEDFSKS